jgi:hypothetical protein
MLRPFRFSRDFRVGDATEISLRKQDALPIRAIEAGTVYRAS